MELLDINAELKNSSEQISEEQLDRFIEAVDSHKRIFVYGTGRFGLMLKALAMRLMQIGCQSYVIGETTTPSVGSKDLLIVASASGETQSVCSAADDAARQGADVLAITGSQESTLSRNHRTEKLSQQKEDNIMAKDIRILVACGSGVATSTIAQEAVKEIAEKAGIKAKIVKGTIAEVPAKQKDVDLVLTTANYRQPLEKPYMSVFGLVSGVGRANTEKKLEELMKQIAEV